MKRILSILLLTGLLVLLASCNLSPTSQTSTRAVSPISPSSITPVFSSNPTSLAYQKTIDSMRSLVKDLRVPSHFGPDKNDIQRAPEDFDVNSYFAVLDHLQMDNGYTLDYFYNRINNC